MPIWILKVKSWNSSDLHVGPEGDDSAGGNHVVLAYHYYAEAYSYATLSTLSLIKQVFPPFLVGTADHTHDMTAGVQVERTGFTQQLHTQFVQQ